MRITASPTVRVGISVCISAMIAGEASPFAALPASSSPSSAARMNWAAR